MTDEQLDEFPEENEHTVEPESTEQPHKESLIAAIHKEKIVAALGNPKAKDDIDLLKEALAAYEVWIKKMVGLTSVGELRVREMTALLNEYKDYIEIDLVATKGSPFLRRQKGQLKLDNSIMKEFLIHLVHPSILNSLPNFDLEAGSHTAFMSLAFRPSSIANLNEKPEVIIKVKDQDFTIGKTIHYKFSSEPKFSGPKTISGKFHLAVLSAECKVNYDKTMFQECAGTAARLKHGCPIAKYYALVEYLDMQPEDTRLTEIDNVFLLRKAKRLPFEKRSSLEEIKQQHKNFPISADVILMFVKEIQSFIDSAWYDPEGAITRGSFL
ncbi:MAG TPA: Bpu10I family restriction endonuclease [Mucilaginibacter sp.]|jgi:hypothetical protein